jgi:hypothetical protein
MRRGGSFTEAAEALAEAAGGLLTAKGINQAEQRAEQLSVALMRYYDAREVQKTPPDPVPGWTCQTCGGWFRANVFWLVRDGRQQCRGCVEQERLRRELNKAVTSQHDAIAGVAALLRAAGDPEAGAEVPGLLAKVRARAKALVDEQEQLQRRVAELEINPVDNAALLVACRAAMQHLEAQMEPDEREEEETERAQLYRVLYEAVEAEDNHPGVELFQELEELRERVAWLEGELDQRLALVWLVQSEGRLLDFIKQVQQRPDEALVDVFAACLTLVKQGKGRP